MRVIASLAVVVALLVPAEAPRREHRHTCAEVRLGVSLLGLSTVLRMARERGATDAHVRWVHSCVEHKI